MTWDPAADEAAGEQCRGFGAAGIMRLPGRLHITWQDDTTLKVETDTGTQTRMLSFRPAPAAEPSWQGHVARAMECSRPHVEGRDDESEARYVRRNGAPYSGKAMITEYWELHTLPNKDEWLTVTTKVDDPTFFTRPYLTQLGFQEAADGGGMDSDAVLREVNRW